MKTFNTSDAETHQEKNHLPEFRQTILIAFIVLSVLLLLFGTFEPVQAFFKQML